MKIAITSKIPESILGKIKELGEVEIHDSTTPLSKEEIMNMSADAEVLVVPLSDKIDQEVLDRAKNVKLVANYGAGYDNIDIAYAKEKGIVITNAPAPSSAVSTAELTFAIMLASAKKLIQSEKDLREGNFLGWRPTYFLGQELRGKTLGIIGMGKIGRNLAKRALAFEMDVIYTSRNRKEDVEEMGVRYVEKEELLKEADFISLHSAFAEELHHMIGKEEFMMMKDTATFMNAARGPLMDEAALVEALKTGEIAAAALDVYEFEPKVTKELLELDNVVLIPHLGNATIEARMEMGEAVYNNLKDYTEGKKPRNQVN